MDNINFLVKILTTGHEYWCAQKVDKWQNHTSRGCDTSIWLISIPYSVRRNLKREEILLSDLEALRGCALPNIPLSQNYAPFQVGQTLYTFTDGFPVEENQKQFLIAALDLGVKDLYKYKELIKANTPEILND